MNKNNLIGLFSIIEDQGIKCPSESNKVKVDAKLENKSNDYISSNQNSESEIFYSAEEISLEK